MNYGQEKAQLLNDPTTPHWMKDLILLAEKKDPVDAWAVVDMVAHLLKKRMEETANLDRPWTDDEAMAAGYPRKPAGPDDRLA